MGVALRQAHLIRSALWFALFSRLSGASRSLKSGVYRLTPADSPAKMLSQMVNGEVAVIRVTIPEGWTTSQVVERLVQAHIGTLAEYHRLLSQPGPGMPTPAKGTQDPWEGYLYPATYAFPWGETASGALKLMWKTFQQRAIQGLYRQDPHPPLPLSQWVTLASIVQAEVARPQDAPLVAGVFMNRLKSGIPLQSDATVRYAQQLLARSGSKGASGLQVDSPYNTYLHKGLPPSPIDNPGLVALKAALYPAKVPYYYFLSTPDGHMLFATTYQEQLQHLNALRAQPGSPPSGHGKS